MATMKTAVYILLCLLLSGSAFAITEGGNELKQGNLELKKKNPSYQKALEYYLIAYSSNANSAELNYKIGLCYLNTNEKNKAIPYLEKSVKASPVVSFDAEYLLAKAYHYNYEFDKAIQQYSKIREKVNKIDDEKELAILMYALTENGKSWPIMNEPTHSTVKKLLSKRISECENGKTFYQKPVNAKIVNLGTVLNSEFPEYSPILKADETELYFTSRRPGTTGGKKDRVDAQFFEDVFISKNVNGKWTQPEALPAPVNTRKHNSALGISADGQTMFLYDMSNGGDILVSFLRGDKWMNPVKLPASINTPDAERSVCISADKRKLFFERDGENRDRNIYMSELNKQGAWKTAVKLPKQINTEYNEDGIFFHPDGKTLYFSSQGHNSMGGYDIFKSELQADGSWTEPVNLGYPINTPDDDIFFILSSDGMRGYYSSIRNDGRGQTDIYMVEMPESTDNTKPRSAVTLLTGTVKDATTKEPVEALIQITDNSTGEVIADLNSNGKSGNYLITLPSGKNYGIAIEKEEYLFHSENFDIPESQDYRKLEKHIELKKAEVGAKVVLRNIFFDFNQSDLKPESTKELDRVADEMKKFNSIKVEISGHTDNVGEDDYNQKLSQSRAEAVKAYLVSKGVSSERLKTAGYGATKPVADNINADGSDNPEGRQLNRRTEFEVIGK